MIKNYGRKKLSRTGSHRKSLVSNMATSLVLNEQVRTTVAKAKEVRRVAENLITCAKKGKKDAVRKVVRSRVAYDKLFDVLAPRYEKRAGGYTRMLKLGLRKGDSAEMTLLKLSE
ncbi:MAG TPA: 50S ribosomal protein L17 [Elusimicrobiales bacterium]|nr:50S ribosomal protein L17 [Elusimicrobiales bacterium]